MKEYYERRAPTYDDWYLGRGRHAARDAVAWEAEWPVLKRYFTPESLLGELGGGETLYAGPWFLVVRAA